MKSEPDNASIFVDPVCGMELVRVSGGVFQMGDTLDQGLPTELPVHEIMLDDFFIARFTVTQVQWDILMGENPSNFKDPQNPVEQITWSDALEFAEKLSRAVSSSVNKPIEFMLPTEAQWEFAARSGGKNDLYSGGSDISAVAWIDENSRGRSHPVGQKRPNDLGIYDMSGNVWEWCLDTFQEDAFSRHDKFNPMMTASSPDRVIRGGSWNLDAWSARCGRRFNFPADFFGPALGFRLVMDRK